MIGEHRGTVVDEGVGRREPSASSPRSATALHVSGKAFARPGWVMAVQLKASPTVYTLAHHRTASNGYWTEPVASVNRDFTRVVFNSNWSSGSDTDVDAYVVEIPARALK